MKTISLISFAALCASVLASVEQPDYSKFAEGSESRDLMKLKGHMSAAFTPVDADGNLDFTNIELMAARLHDWGVPNVMLGGTTGESLSFTTAERMQVVQEWLKIAPKHELNVYVHVGMDSLQEARAYTEELAKMDGIMGIFSMSSVYFKPASIPDLADAMAEIAAGAPELPFWYYHFPANTNVDFNMFQFIEHVDESGKIPNLMGVKFTNEILMDFSAAGHFKNKKYNMLFGRDEQNISALATGVADADVSSTINYMSFNLDAANAWHAGNITQAEDLQMQTVDVIETWVKMCVGYNPQKSILKMTGIDFGPLRLPQENMPADLEKQLGTALASLGVNITSEYINSPNMDNVFFLN